LASLREILPRTGPFAHCRKTPSERDQPLLLVCRMADVREIADLLTYIKRHPKAQ
jgi:hypothetical protein